MSKWSELSIEYANQRSYLDDLFQVYPTIPEGIREIDEAAWSNVEKAFKRKNNDELIRVLLSLDLFPNKDSYIAYLKLDKTSIDRNPRTINRICGSGTTLKSAQLQNRLWIGIDQSEYAINATKEKLSSIEGNLFSPKPYFEIITTIDINRSCQKTI